MRMTAKFPVTMLLVTGSAFLAGCEINAPEPSLVHQANDIQITTTEFDGIGAGEPVAGTIRLSIPPGLAPFEIARVKFYVDSTEVYTSYDPPFTYDLNTTSYPQGDHLVFLEVYERNPSLGLFNLLQAPRLVCGNSMIFDQTPPASIGGLTVSWDGMISIRWNPLTTPAFRNYWLRVRVHSDYMGDSFVFDRYIFDRDSTEWRLSSSWLPGVTVEAYITADNGAQIGPFSFASGMVGTALPVSASIRSFWNHPSTNETYAWGWDNRMYVLSADGSTVVRSSPVLTSRPVMMRSDGAVMYVFNAAVPAIAGYSLSDFSSIGSIALPDSMTSYATCVLSPNGNFYVGNYQGKIWVYRESTGAFVSYMRFLEYLTTAPTFIASADGTSLFYKNEPDSLFRIDIQTDTPVVAQRIAVPSPWLDRLLALQDQQRLIATSGSSVHVLSASDLSILATVPLVRPSCSSSTLQDYAATLGEDGNKVYIASAARYVTEIDLSTYQQSGTRCLLNAPQCIGFSRNGQFLFLGSMGTPQPNLVLNR